MPGELLFETERAQVRRVEPEDGEALQALFERCEDFFRLVYGHPPGPAETQSHFVALPEGRTYDDKFAAAIYEEGEPIGAFDAIRNHPEPGGWVLGLLLFDPSHRGHGLGAEVSDAFERWAASLGGTEVRILVQLQNTGGYAFWKRMGYEHIDTVRRRAGLLDSDCAVMAKRLG